MNTKSIDQANNADLRGSWQAMQRAARRARELAAQTGTDLVISRDGVIELIKPVLDATCGQVREKAAPSGDKP